MYTIVIRDRKRLKCYLQRWFLNSSVEYIDSAKWQLTECGKKGLKKTDDWIVIKICRGRRWDWQKDGNGNKYLIYYAMVTSFMSQKSLSRFSIKFLTWLVFFPYKVINNFNLSQLLIKIKSKVSWRKFFKRFQTFKETGYFPLHIGKNIN